MRFYILAGSLASGKGTQSELILDLNPTINYLSTGELFRKEVAKNTPMGKIVKDLMDKGQLVSDDQTNAIFVSFLQTLDKDAIVLLDGYPRSRGQAEFFNKYIQQNEHVLDKVFLLELDPSVVEKRILGRFSCARCGTIYNDTYRPTKKSGICDICGNTIFVRRVSDSKEIIQTRLKLYQETTVAALKLLEKEENIIRINANGLQSDIFEEIQKHMNL